MTCKIPDHLFVLEMANNHMGDLAHGIELIRQFRAICDDFPEFTFAFKLQYRDLDSFIHPEMKNRQDIKYIKRFSETRLTRAEFDQLIAEIRHQGFLAAATPFDEVSVDVIAEQNLDMIKIASCSFSDWPLLEKIATTQQPVIASTAGATLEELDRVVSFLLHRNKNFAIMHCVGEYPTADDKLQLGQIDFLKKRYPGVRIGFSTHEDPNCFDTVKLAIAKGASIFEKHVGIVTDKYSINAYSATPDQVKSWLSAARAAIKFCGNSDQRVNASALELANLSSLRRGVFARRALSPGETLNAEDIYFAFPPEDNQFTANDWSKYASFVTKAPILKDQAICLQNTDCRDNREKIWKIAQQVRAMLSESHIVVPGGVDLEISHHYGIENFDKVGLTMMTIVNRGYCKKILVLLPGQSHPEQFHKVKEETFHVLFGDVHMSLDGIPRKCSAGDVVNIEPGVRHAFESHTGAVIEEISSTHHQSDSFYTDKKINDNPSRKTLLTYWME